MIDFSQYQSSIDKVSNQVFSSVGDYLQKQILGTPPLTKQVQNPGGNLSQAQLNAGMRPVTQTVIPNNNKEGMMKNYGPWIAGGVIVLAALFFYKKGK